MKKLIVNLFLLGNLSSTVGMAYSLVLEPANLDCSLYLNYEQSSQVNLYYNGMRIHSGTGRVAASDANADMLFCQSIISEAKMKHVKIIMNRDPLPGYIYGYPSWGDANFLTMSEGRDGIELQR